MSGDSEQDGNDGIRSLFRFRVGQTVWVRDYRYPRGCKVVEAKVRELHEHHGRHPWYPNGEGYALDGELWWDCYPGCRVFGAHGEAIAGRLPKNRAEAEELAHLLLVKI